MLETFAQLLAYIQFQDFLKEAILLLIAGTPLFLLVMLLHKFFTERHERQLSQAKHRYLSACYRYLGDSDNAVQKPRSHRETMAMADVLIYLLAETESNLHPRIQSLALSLDVAGKLSQLATQSRSWVNRLLAIEKLGFLRLPEMAPLYRKLLPKEREPHIIAKLLWALSQIAIGHDIQLINTTLTSQPVISGKFNELLYLNIIKSFCNRGSEAELLEHIGTMLADPDLTLQLKRDLIEACGAGQLTASRPLLQRAFREYPKESTIKIACLRAIGVMGGDLDGQLTRPALADPDWRVRAVAARYAAQAPKEILPVLSRVLGDRNYHVRINAARALAASGEEGRGMLRNQLNGQDRFIHDICSYVLEGF